MSTDLIQIIEGQRNDFQRVICDQSINFDREAGFALQILNSNDYLAKVAMSNKDSIRNAVTNVAAIGISLNPASKLAYLVPRKGAVCLDISYMGMLHLAQISGAIQWGQAAIVRANDTFALNGVDKQPTHSYNPFAGVLERGEVIGCYLVVKTDSGDFLTHTMTAAQINSIRDRSEAYKGYLKNKTSCPWVTDYEEMAKKTVVKQAAKYWPRRDRIDSAIHYLNVEGEEGLDSVNNKNHITNPTVDETFNPDENQIVFMLSVVDNIIANKHDLQKCCDLLYGSNLDNEEITWIWKELKPHSALRSAIKKQNMVVEEDQAEIAKAVQSTTASNFEAEEKALKSAGSLHSLQEVWLKFDKPTQHAMAALKEECKLAIIKAETEADVPQ